MVYYRGPPESTIVDFEEGAHDEFIILSLYPGPHKSIRLHGVLWIGHYQNIAIIKICIHGHVFESNCVSAALLSPC